MSSGVEESTVVVTGGTGFVGTALIEQLLQKGYSVRCITRDPQGAELPTGVSAAGWSELEEALEGARALVHLAGAQAVGKRLTESYKKLILDSRVETTKNLVAALGKVEARPSTFVCASAIGYYGDQPFNKVLSEDAPPGDDFLAEVCKQWESAALKGEDLGVRVVRGRVGIVLGKGGPLEVMAQPFKMFVGGPIAGGKQPVSWIDRRDIARAIVFCIEDTRLQGPVNLVAPEATTNGKLSSTIARVLGRPNMFPVPKFGLKMLFGEGADAIASGQHVVPQKLLDAGFRFEHTDLETVVRDHLG